MNHPIQSLRSHSPTPSSDTLDEYPSLAESDRNVRDKKLLQQRFKQITKYSENGQMPISAHISLPGGTGNRKLHSRTSSRTNRTYSDSLSNKSPIRDLLPVLLSPEKLIFQIGASQNNENILSLYNPFEIDIDYKVYSTDPAMFTVRVGEGTVQSQFKVDILLKCQFPPDKAITANHSEKILVKIFSNNSCLGKKEIPVYFQSKTDSNLAFKQNVRENGFISSDKQTRNGTANHHHAPKQEIAIRRIPWIPVAISSISLAVLAIPTNYEFELLNYSFHVNNYRLIAAFILGVMLGRYWR